MLYNITYFMLYNITYFILYNIKWHMLYNITWHMLYNMEWSLCSQHCVTRDSSDYLTYKTKQTLNFPFYPFSHLFMPNQFFDKKKKGQELKQNNWKYLRDLTRTRVTKISRISWMRHFPVNWFFYSEGQSFFLHGQDKDNDSFTWPLV